MTSLRHKPESEPQPEPSARDAYLDAARACILDVGWRRTTLTEVARRARVSRMTIYRTWPDMPTLLGDLMTREWAGVVDGVRSGVRSGAHDEGDQLTVLRMDVPELVQRLRANELFMRIVEVDPELILPYLLERRGRSQDSVLSILAAGIADGQASGAIRRADPTLLARTIVLAAQGFVLSAQTMVDDDVALKDLDHELENLIERVLRP